MVEGCLEWQEHGLEEPKTVTEATMRYREEMDTLAAFFEERCVIRKGVMTPASRLYKQYQMWCDDAGENAETQKMFGMRLSERGFVSEKIKRGQHKDRKGWLGIGLRADDPEPEDPDHEGNTPPDNTPDVGDGPLGGERADDHPPREMRPFAGKLPRDTPAADDSGPKNKNPSYTPPRVEENTEKRSASSASSAKDVESLLTNAPAWLQRQADKHLQSPATRTLNPLCVAVATHLYGDAGRWHEVKPTVERWLKGMEGTA
jgi:phage/plasmid-associated DNA primase